MNLPTKNCGSSLLRLVCFAVLISLDASAAREEMAESLKAVASGITHFTSNLYNTVAAHVGRDENIFLSPYSIGVVSGMALVGAGGDTQTQLKETFNLKGQSDETILAGFSELITKTNSGDGSISLDTANRLYVHQAYKILDTYNEALMKSFHATSESVNFGDGQSHLTINRWVEEQTRDKIKDLIPAGALNALTRLVLVNAIYFKGSWAHKFDKERTVPKPFHLSASKHIDVPMMHNNANFRVGSNPELGVRTLEMPYMGNRLSMLIVLPNEVDGLAAVEKKLQDDPAAWKKMEQMMRSFKVEVALPKFKIEASIELSDVMKKMGVTDMFDENKADLSGISGRKDLFVSAIFHKAFIDVNEEGTEAAAATGMIMMTKMAIIPQQPFVADRPFMFFIRDTTTGTVLFAGSLRNPAKSE